ncbi:MAG TPA: type II toxin-antitoxin system VapC family toxin [Tepidisphaeraceae bacterium]|jgi:predicted nucleic acid-binding protein|nr:type II toxin-antitoxin system VapC family toxin [Tepidisphaeraceae bacterium]
MKYILDASVALKWALIEADSPRAMALRQEARRGLHRLLAPDIFPLEIANALTRAERKGILQPPQAVILLADILSTPPEFLPSLPLLPRAVELSSQSRCGIYDCLYVAAAEEEACELVTADEKLIRSLPRSPLILLGSL